MRQKTGAWCGRMAETYYMQQCPIFYRCSAPLCPLDPDEHLRTKRFPGEQKCTLHRKSREAIGAVSSLPRLGLTKREWSARKDKDA